MVPISVCPSHGSTKIVRPPPAGAIAPATTGSVAPGTMMWVPRLGRMTGTSASSCSSSGPQPVGPHAGGVDDVGGAHLELLAARASRTRAPTARPPSSSSPHASTPLTATAPKRSASASTVSTSRASSVWQS